MPRKPKTSTEASLAAMAKAEKIRKLEERIASGWSPPPPKEKVVVRAPDLLEEKDKYGRVQLTIFAAISKANGDARYEELQKFAQQAGHPGEEPARQTARKGRARVQESEKVFVEKTDEQKAIDEWLASALG